jgi:hypothetical protein
MVVPTGAVAQSSHDALIAKHAAEHGLPESLVRRVIQIESRGNPRAVSKGNYGLMQIRLGTARAMGYRGDANGLLDADTNMTYAVKYLAGAYRAAGCNPDRAIRNYQRGYHGVRHHNCATPYPAQTQLASAASQPAAPPHAAARNSSAAPQPADVLKPRVVQTVVVSRRDLQSLQAPKVAAADPKVAPPPPLPMARPKPPAPPELVAAESLRAPVAAKPDGGAVPLPPVKVARLQPEPETDVRQTSPSQPKRSNVRASGKRSASGSNDLVSFVRRLVTPDPRSRARTPHFDRHTQQ